MDWLIHEQLAYKKSGTAFKLGNLVRIAISISRVIICIVWSSPNLQYLASFHALNSRVAPEMAAGSTSWLSIELHQS